MSVNCTFMKRDSVEIRDLRSSLSIQLQSIDFSRESSETQSRSLSLPSQPGIAYAAAIPNESPAQLATSPETYSMIQSHLRDAVRSVGDAVPWSAHQHLATNREGTKRAHIVASELSYESHTLPQPPVSISQGPTAQALHQPAPLVMPRPLVSHRPSAGSAVFDATNSSTPQMPPTYLNPVQVPSCFVHYNAASSVSTQQGETSLQHEIVSGGPALYPTGFAQPMQFTVEDVTSQHSLNMPLSVIDTALPDSVQSAVGPVCLPSQVTNTNGKVRRQLRIQRGPRQVLCLTSLSWMFLSNVVSRDVTSHLWRGDLTVKVIAELAFANIPGVLSVLKARLVSASHTEGDAAAHFLVVTRERETSFSAQRKSCKWDKGESRFFTLMGLTSCCFVVSPVTEEASVALTQAARNPPLADHSRARAMEAESVVRWRAVTNQRSLARSSV